MNKIQSIQKGSLIIDKIFWELLHLIQSRQVLTEQDLARKIKQLAKQMGGQGVAFSPTIVAFGPASSEIHHWPTNHTIGRNNFLMLDYGVKVNNYCTDFTRTLFIGNPNKQHEKIYNTVLKAYNTAIKEVKINADCRKIDAIPRKIITKAGFPNFKHRVGHGLGHEIHEPPLFGPDSTDRLQKNDVITIEPGIYLPSKCGVRIEDMILVAIKPKIFSQVPKDFKNMIVK